MNEEITKTPEQLSIERIQLSSQIAKMQESLEKFSAQQAEIVDLTGKLEDLKTEIENASSTVDYHQKMLNNLTEANQVERAEGLKYKSNLGGEVASLMNSISSLKLEKTSLKLQIKETQEDVDFKYAEILRLDEQLNEITKEIEILNIRREDTCKSVKKAETDLSKITSLVETRQTELADVITKLSEEKLSLQALQSKQETVEKATTESIKGYTEDKFKRDGERKEFEEWKATETSTIESQKAELTKKEEDLNIREAWIDKKINAVRRYKGELELSTGRRLDNLTI